jgi:hypothetical protein
MALSGIFYDNLVDGVNVNDVFVGRTSSPHYKLSYGTVASALPSDAVAKGLDELYNVWKSPFLF